MGSHLHGVRGGEQDKRAPHSLLERVRGWWQRPMLDRVVWGDIRRLTPEVAQNEMRKPSARFWSEGGVVVAVVA